MEWKGKGLNFDLDIYIRCLSLGQLLTFPLSQCLYMEQNNSTYLPHSLWVLCELIYVKLLEEYLT